MQRYSEYLPTFVTTSEQSQFVIDQAKRDGVKMSVIMRQAIEALREKPETVYASTGFTAMVKAFRITTEQWEFIEEQCNSGRKASRSQVLRNAIKALMNKEKE